MSRSLANTSTLLITAIIFFAACGDDEPDKFGIDENGSQSNVCLELADTESFEDTNLGDTQFLSISVTNCSDADTFVSPSLSGSEDIALIAANEVRIRPGATASIGISFSPTTPTTHESTLTFVVEGEPVDESVRIVGNGLEDSANCPTARIRMRLGNEGVWTNSLDTVPTDTLLKLDGSGSDGVAPIAEYAWSITSSPMDSNASLSSNASASPSVAFDRVGDYRIELFVVDEFGRMSCEPAVVTVTAGDSEFTRGITVELVWDTPTDEDQNDEVGVDVDLHFKHPNGQWNQEPYDIFWRNQTADWGEPGEAGNPRMTIDDTDGAGPEVIILEEPEAIHYDVGVYYYSDFGFGPSYATVRVYLNGVLVEEVRDQFMQEQGVFWHAMRVDWGARSVTQPALVDMGFPGGEE